MDAKQLQAFVHAKAVELSKQIGCRGQDATGMEYHIYTAPNSTRDIDMIVLYEVLINGGAKAHLHDVAHDVNLPHEHRRTTPCVVVDYNNRPVVVVEVDAPKDVDLLKWLGAEGSLAPSAVRMAYNILTATEDSAKTADEAKKADEAAALSAVKDALCSDKTASEETKAIIDSLLELASPEVVKKIADKLSAIKNKS